PASSRHPARRFIVGLACVAFPSGVVRYQYSVRTGVVAGYRRRAYRSLAGAYRRLPCGAVTVFLVRSAAAFSAIRGFYCNAALASWQRRPVLSYNSILTELPRRHDRSLGPATVPVVSRCVFSRMMLPKKIMRQGGCHERQGDSGR